MGEDQRTEAELADIAAGLADAWEHARTVDAPTRTHPGTTLADAYRIQELVVDRRLAGVRRRAGWKMGLTSSPDAEPIVGTLLDDMVVATGTRLAIGSMVAPLVEAELAFVAGARVEPGAGRTDLAVGPHAVAPALEVIDYRTRDSNGVVDWVADNSTVAYAVVGERTSLADAGELADIGVALGRAGEEVASGRGSLVMGDPLIAVEWLVRHLADRGRSLEEGDVVLTGSLTGHVDVVAGDTFQARFDRLGTVTVGFTA